MDKQLRSAWFEDLDVIGDVYKIECRKPKVKINRPFHAGIVVYQMAKLRMLELDTDSMYFALAYDKLEEAIKPERRKEFEQEKNEWLSWDKWSNRTPGLFKLEKEGTRAIVLCSKCYFVEDEAGGQAKMSSKSVNKKQNELRWERYERALEGYKDMATSRGFRMHQGVMYTYEQRKLGLSAYYDKRWVLEDGIHTEPIEFHMPN